MNKNKELSIENVLKTKPNNNCNYIIAFLFICSLYFLGAKLLNFWILPHSFLAGMCWIIQLIVIYLISLLCNNKIIKIFVITITLLCFIGIIYFYLGEYIFIKKEYQKKYEYVDAIVLEKEISSYGKFRVYVKCKLLDNNKIVKIYNEPMTTSVGDKVCLVKITYYKEGSTIKKYIVYKPSNYPVKRFVIKNENIVLYQDLINNTNTELNVSDFKNDKIEFSRSYARAPICINFVCFTKEDFHNYLLNFTEKIQLLNTNMYHGTKIVKDIPYGTFYLYNEPNCSYGIVKYKDTNDYLVISIPLNIFEKYYQLNIENLEKEFYKILNIK